MPCPASALENTRLFSSRHLEPQGPIAPPHDLSLPCRGPICCHFWIMNSKHQPFSTLLILLLSYLQFLMLFRLEVSTMPLPHRILEKSSGLVRLRGPSCAFALINNAAHQWNVNLKDWQVGRYSKLKIFKAKLLSTLCVRMRRSSSYGLNI